MNPAQTITMTFRTRHLDRATVTAESPEACAMKAARKLLKLERGARVVRTDRTVWTVIEPVRGGGETCVAKLWEC